ncbi:MAG TPA: glycerophosphodiester phosphodiesterase family protein, partial [Paenisporosarcina sp.]|nr:glycerophosphodiester phosphodiesterase family protein [Paenisporosarcina sp.]
MIRVPIYAHRGASAYALENSSAAFMKAIELGADGLEID